MSTRRRTLGTGPTTTIRSTTTSAAPRLLPAERADRDTLLAADDERQDVLLQTGRRNLGAGPKSSPMDS